MLLKQKIKARSITIQRFLLVAAILALGPVVIVKKKKLSLGGLNTNDNKTFRFY
jgi:hypothetical protein